MIARTLLIPAALLAVAASPALAQDPAPDPPPTPQVVERVNRRAPSDDGAVTAERSRAPEVRARERLDAPTPAASPTAPAFDDQGGRRRPGGGSGGGGRVSGGSPRGSGSGGAVRRGSVRSPDNDGSGTNADQAVPRRQAPRGGWGPSTAWSPRYERRYYGGAGFGYYFYDPWSWYGWGWPAYGAYSGWGWSGGYYGSPGYYGSYGTYGGPYGWSIGGVRLKVDHRDAEVFVDGYYAGTVDDFDGMFQQLRLDDGGYRIEIRKPGFETLVFDVRIMPGRTITYRGHMVPAP